MTKRQKILVGLAASCNGRTVADVGCDHGYIGAELLLSGGADFVHFVEISAAPLKKAQSLCEKLSLKGCDFILQDGLADIKTDCCVIAGMGGKEIIKILSEATSLPSTLVLQPMKNAPELRTYLCRNYFIEQDFLRYDGKKFYNFLLCRRGQDSLDELQTAFGKTNLIEPHGDFKKYLTVQIDNYHEIMHNTNDADCANNLRLLDLCVKEINNATRNF